VPDLAVARELVSGNFIPESPCPLRPFRTGRHVGDSDTQADSI